MGNSLCCSEPEDIGFAKGAKLRAVGSNDEDISEAALHALKKDEANQLK
jgi:hypothetical protein